MATTTAERFRNRVDAGRQLAERLSEYRGRDDVVVLGLPRDGVPVAFEIVSLLGAPPDDFLVRKPARGVRSAYERMFRREHPDG